MKNLKKENERLVNEDIVIRYRFIDENTGDVIVDPTDFALRFYIKGRRKAPDNSFNEVVCSKHGDAYPVNCEIDTNGYIYCFLPKNTFYPGRLIIETLNAFPHTGFEDGDWEVIERGDTGVNYIR